MIIGRMLKKDFLRKKLITIVVFAFIFLAALLVASGTNLMIELGNSLDSLFAKANTAHFVQMHAGPLDQAEIDSWTAANELVSTQQTVEMITMDNANLYLGDSRSSEENSIMDVSFVTQNEGFDFLLDLDNNIIQLEPGEIAVPVYYIQERDLEIGDAVRVTMGAEEMVFTITTFNRDSQMNPAIASSKRFLIHEQEFASLRETIVETEYLIEFLLVDESKIGDFANAYQSSNLPQTGPAIDKGLFKIMNSLSDGLVAGVVFLMSLLLIVIAILCLRFTLMATIEEDTREIGVMKAIGIARFDIKRIYLAKYVVMGAAAVLLGYLTSLLLNQVLSANILLYIGRASKSVLQTAVPFIATSSIFLIVTVSCVVILRRFNHISAVEALRSGSVGNSMGRISLLNLKRGRALNINLYLGVRDVLQRTRFYGLLAFVFFFCAVMILIPIHFLTTIQSPTFISYLGSGHSDIRIDLRQSEDVADRFETAVATLKDDPDVAKLSPLVTSQFKVLQSDGTLETLNAVSVLITSLFMMMLISKDSNQIAIFRSLGFSLQHIRIQYLTRALFLLAFGIVLGTLFANTLGQQLVSAVFSLQGASRIKFVIDPLQAYVVYPLLLMVTVAVTTFLSTRTGIKETNIAEMIME